MNKARVQSSSMTIKSCFWISNKTVDNDHLPYSLSRLESSRAWRFRLHHPSQLRWWGIPLRMCKRWWLSWLQMLYHLVSQARKYCIKRKAPRSHQGLFICSYQVNHGEQFLVTHCSEAPMSWRVYVNLEITWKIRLRYIFLSFLRLWKALLILKK